MAKLNDEKAQKKFEEMQAREAEELAQMLSVRRGIPYLDLSRLTIDLDSLKILDEAGARAGKIVIFQSVGKKLQAGVLNPELDKTQEMLNELKEKHYEVKVFQISEKSLNKALALYAEISAFKKATTGLVALSEARIEEFKEKIKGIAGLEEEVSKVAISKETHKASEILEIILAGALRLDASDIHIEPGDLKTHLRYRLDGVLRDIIQLPPGIYTLLNSRVKLLSELKLNITSRAQDGRFTIRTKVADIEVRTSILPGPYGEAIVLRILNPKSIQTGYENLGMHPYLLKKMAKELARPNGMILTTGPTGSGKTTTLYAFLKKANEPGIKIVTIEDPIEYHIAGIVQTQVEADKGYDFASGLRSILRQDPDIILVGEIRDLETAETAMHASLTGHLVFSTLHTNDAAGTIPRLIDLGVKPNIIAPAINVAMAQRLIRVLCKSCARKETPSPVEQKLIEDTLKNLPAQIEKPDFKNISVSRAVGCEACNSTGYKGRSGVFEAFFVDDLIERLIISDPSEAGIRQGALKQGMMTIRQDGILKVLQGITSFEELNRVVGED